MNNELTPLQNKIARHIEKEYEGETNSTKSYYDKVGVLASEACKEWIQEHLERAFNESRLTILNGNGKYYYTLNDWLKSNGII